MEVFEIRISCDNSVHETGSVQGSRWRFGGTSKPKP